MRFGLDGLCLPVRKRTQRLPFPARREVRIALVGANPAVFRHARNFPADRWSELSAYAPQILVGSQLDLMLIAAKSKANRLELSSVDHALFAVTRYGDAPLTDEIRTTLWRTFGVPVYELFTGAGDGLLASECEAHEGWHVEARVVVAIVNEELIFTLSRESRLESGLTGEVITARCPCGRGGVRIDGVRLLGLSGARPVLAVA